jgi:hypothetical protein
VTNSWDDKLSYLSAPGGSGDVYLNEVLFEIHQVGNSVRVSEIDPRTNTEVVVVGSPHMSPYSLKINTVRKLKYVMGKNQAARRSKG